MVFVSVIPWNALTVKRGGMVMSFPTINGDRITSAEGSAAFPTFVCLSKVELFLRRKCIADF